MKRIALSFGLLGALAAGLLSCAKSEKGFTIRGEAPEGQEIAVLVYDTPAGEPVRDTVKVVDGRYAFCGKVDDVVPGSILFPREGEKLQRVGIYVENAPLTVLGDHRVTGGPNNDFSDFRQNLIRVIGECVAAHPDVEVAAFIYYIYNQDTPTDAYEEGFNRFTDKVKNSEMARRAREEIASRKATAPGVQAPDFTLNDPDGKPSLPCAASMSSWISGLPGASLAAKAFPG